MSRKKSPGARSLPLAPTRARWTPDLLRGVAEGEARVLRRLLVTGSANDVTDAAAEASGRAAELCRAADATEPPATPIACRDKCGACCVSKVVAAAPEVLRIAEHLRATLDDDALPRVLDRVRAADARTRGLSRRERAEAGVPCPLLVDGSCSVHAVRPLICRGWNSLDVGACERHFAAPAVEPVAPVHAVAYELASAVLAGLGKACIDAGLDGAPLELVAGLRIALERENAAERWMRGLPVFAMARDGERSESGEPEES